MPVIMLQNCGGDIAQLEFYDQTRPRMEETAPTPVATYGRGTKFTLGDLKTVEPGQVRHDSPPADPTPSYDAIPPKYRVTPLGEFITDECP